MSAAEIQPGRVYLCRVLKQGIRYNRAILEVHGDEVTLIRGWFENVSSSDGPNDPWTLSSSGPQTVSKGDIEDIEERIPAPVPGSLRRNFWWASPSESAADATERSDKIKVRNGPLSGTGQVPQWTLRIGDKILRSKLHDTYGGNRQRGIAPSSQHPHIFVFTDSSSGDPHGYMDHWDGRDLFYFGEGQRGDMTMTRGNLALLEHESKGKALRLFEGASGSVVYVGQYRVSGEPERVTAPDTTGSLREAIVFRLVPIDAAPELGLGTVEAVSGPYRESNKDARSRPARPSISAKGSTDVADTSTGKVLAQRFQQDGVVMYVTALPARLINALGTVDTWQPGIPDDHEDQGYQREVVKSHARRIARYLLDEDEEHLMPTAVLLSSREPLAFQPMPVDNVTQDGPESFGVLELRGPLYKVDGQHRTAGFELAVEEDASLGGFPLPTVIMEVRNKMEEIRQFFTVNTTAKRVRTDLADRLLKAMGDFSHDTAKNWMLEALEIVDILNSEDGGPWKGGIKLPNSPGGIASQKTWTESLKPVLNGILSDQSPATVAKALSNFWAALQDMMPEAFEEPKEYVLQKTTGVFAFNDVAAQIFKIAYREGSDLSKDALRAILMRGDDSGKFDAAFWANTQHGGEAPMYAGRGGMSRLAQEILEAIPEASTVKINL